MNYTDYIISRLDFHIIFALQIVCKKYLVLFIDKGYHKIMKNRKEQEGSTVYYNPYESFNPQYEDPKQSPQNIPSRVLSPKKPRRAIQALGKCLLALVLVCGISLASVGGYVWYENNYGASAATAAGAAVQTQETSAQKVVYYQLGTDEDAMTVPQIYEKNLPSVVLFTCEIPASTSSGYYGYGFGQGQQQQQQTQTATGSGIILTADGYVMTNNHVVEEATKITVTLWDGKEYEAKLVGADENTDIAVVKINATGLTPAEFGDSDQLIVGENAIVIGNPLGQTFAETLTAGYISATERTLTIDNTMMTLIQTDAAVNPGNSGGPLINSRGQVVGVINSKISEEDVEGIGFAIPSNIALQITNDFIKYGYVASRPMLGISVQSVSDEQAAYYNIEAGITVKEVVEGSCAAKGGIKAGDKIIAFNGVTVSTSAELNYQKSKYKVGDVVTVTVERNGQKSDLTIKLEGSTQQ